jgi:hypothetical protein
MEDIFVFGLVAVPRQVKFGQIIYKHHYKFSMRIIGIIMVMLEITSHYKRFLEFYVCNSNCLNF